MVGLFKKDARLGVPKYNDKISVCFILDAYYWNSRFPRCEITKMHRLFDKYITINLSFYDILISF